MVLCVWFWRCNGDLYELVVDTLRSWVYNMLIHMRWMHIEVNKHCQHVMTSISSSHTHDKTVLMPVRQI